MNRSFLNYFDLYDTISKFIKTSQTKNEVAENQTNLLKALALINKKRIHEGKEMVKQIEVINFL